MQPFYRFALVVALLRAETEDIRAERLQFLEVIAKAARLRRAAARAGNRVPSRRQLDVRAAGPRITVDDDAAGKRREVDHPPRGGFEPDRGHSRAREMIAKAARLRRAAARAGNRVPSRRQLDVRAAGPRITVDDCAAGKRREGDHPPRGGFEPA